MYLKSRRHWEYDCPLHLGWACYLQFRCNETGVFADEMDFSDVRTTFHDRDFASREYPKIYDVLQSVYETNYKDGSDTSCDVKKTNPTILTSMAAKFLFNLNDHTKQFSKKFNERYMIDAGVPYVSLQLRSQDKKYEMSAETWAWISNMQNVYDTMKPFIDEASGIKHLFVSTDNCTLLGELTPLLPSHIAVASPCHKHEGEDSHTAVAMTGDENQDLVGEFNPRRKDFRSTQRLFAEVLMLAGGQHFFGIMNSNLVRFIHRLRYPDHQNTSHGLACMLTPATQFKCKYDSMKT